MPRSDDSRQDQRAAVTDKDIQDYLGLMPPRESIFEYAADGSIKCASVYGMMWCDTLRRFWPKGDKQSRRVRFDYPSPWASSQTG